MGETIVTPEVRAGQIERRENTAKVADEQINRALIAELQSMSVADRLMRQHQTRALKLTREDEAGIFGFEVRQITYMEREAITSLSNTKFPDTPEKMAEATNKLYADIRSKAAELVITPDVKEYILSGAAPDSFNMWVLSQTMLSSARALEVVASFRQNSGGAGLVQYLSDDKKVPP